MHLESSSDALQPKQKKRASQGHPELASSVNYISVSTITLLYILNFNKRSTTKRSINYETNKCSAKIESQLGTCSHLPTAIS